MTRVAIVTYSTYGHINVLAESVKAGVDATGVEATIYQVPETLPEEVLTKMHAPPKRSYPIATPETLEEADAIIFGFPTRFGAAPAQISSFTDLTGGLWAKGALSGKPAAVFVLVGTIGGGLAGTVRSFLSFLTHHGMLYVPLGYKNTFAQASTVDEAQGLTPYGAGTFAAGDGSREPSALELEIAEIQGKTFAETVLKLRGETKAETKEPAVKKVEKLAAAAKPAVATEKPAAAAAAKTPAPKTKEGSGCCVIV